MMRGKRIAAAVLVAVVLVAALLAGVAVARPAPSDITIEDGLLPISSACDC